MKKTIFFALISLISITSFSQSRTTMPDPPKPGDTVFVKKGRFVQYNGRTYNLEVLDQAIVVLTKKDVDQIVTTLQEYPARFANPFTEFLLQYLGLQPRKAPEDKPKQ